MKYLLDVGSVHPLVVELSASPMLSHTFCECVFICYVCVQCLVVCHSTCRRVASWLARTYRYATAPEPNQSAQLADLTNLFIFPHSSTIFLTSIWFFSTYFTSVMAIELNHDYIRVLTMLALTIRVGSIENFCESI